MHVLIASMSIDTRRGTGIAQKATLMARALLRAGERVTILTSDTFDSARLQELRGADIVQLPLLNRRFWIPLPMPGRVRMAVAAADVVVIHNHWPLLNMLTARAARRMAKPTVVIPSGALPMLGRSAHMKRVFNALGGLGIIRDATLHVATTAEEARDFEAYGVRADRVHIIPNAVEMAPQGASANGLYPSPFILFAGRLYPSKGPHLLLDAFFRIADRIPHHLVFAGPDRGMLEELRVQAAGKPASHRVHFTGYLSPAEVAPAIAASDIVVVPSLFDTMPLVILEAGVHARPAIITDRCGAQAFVDTGVVRLTTADPAAIADALLDVLTSADQGRSLGRALHDYVLSHHTWDVVVERYRELFRRIV
jgi:glycosyltransferase involved in cell wall biosynthesis